MPFFCFFPTAVAAAAAYVLFLGTTRDAVVEEAVVVESHILREQEERTDMWQGRNLGVLCFVTFLKPPMASTLLSLRSTPSCRIFACSSTRNIATSAQVLARVAAGKATKKYGKGKGAEPKKKKKLSPGAEMKLQVQKYKKKYDENPYKMTLADAINVIRVC